MDEKDTDAIQENISEYAATTIAELFAEAVAENFISNNPRELAKDVWAEYNKRVKWYH